MPRNDQRVPTDARIVQRSVTPNEESRAVGIDCKDKRNGKCRHANDAVHSSLTAPTVATTTTASGLLGGEADGGSSRSVDKRSSLLDPNRSEKTDPTASAMHNNIGQPLMTDEERRAGMSGKNNLASTKKRLTYGIQEEEDEEDEDPTTSRHATSALSHNTKDGVPGRQRHPGKSMGTATQGKIETVSSRRRSIQPKTTKSNVRTTATKRKYGQGTSRQGTMMRNHPMERKALEDKTNIITETESRDLRCTLMFLPLRCCFEYHTAARLTKRFISKHILQTPTTLTTVWAVFQNLQRWYSANLAPSQLERSRNYLLRFRRW